MFEGDPKELAGMFIKSASELLNRKLMGFIVGSVRDEKYVAGKSDIDLVILARDGTLTAGEYLKIYELSQDYGKKYGVVKKKGRPVPVIDPLMFLSEQSQKLVKELADDKKLIPVVV